MRKIARGTARRGIAWCRAAVSAAAVWPPSPPPSGGGEASARERELAHARARTLPLTTSTISEPARGISVVRYFGGEGEKGREATSHPPLTASAGAEGATKVERSMAATTPVTPASSKLVEASSATPVARSVAAEPGASRGAT